MEKPSETVTIELSSHCIETTARTLYQRLVGDYLEERAGPEVEPAITILTEFLEGTDFRHLRTQDEELAGGHRVDVVLFRGDDGGVRWRKE
jgi:hypothetical protein